MASGLETGAGILTCFDAALTLLNGCVKAIVLISAARHASENADRIRFMLQWEELRLLRWAERTGLEENQPNPVINWALVENLLERLFHELEDANVLNEKYNLLASNSPATYQSNRIEEAKSSALLKGLQSRISSSLRRIRQRAIDTGTVAYKSLTWVTIDQDKIKTLVGNVKEINNCLQQLLDDAQQQYIMAGLEELLRDLVSRTSNDLELEAIKAVTDPETSAVDNEVEPSIQLKSARLMAGVDTRSDERWLSKRPKPSLSVIKFECFSEVTDLNKSNWQTAVCRKQSSKVNIDSFVLLEWKDVPISLQARFERRIQELTFLLSSSIGVCSLKCLGYVKRASEADYAKYAYVFELADLRQDSDAKQVPPQNLRSLIRSTKRCSLTRRIFVALTVAEAVLELHTSGWLHKNISSSTVIFKGDANIVALKRGSGPFLSGFEFIRSNLEASENVEADVDAELYRHPDYPAKMAANATTEVSYRKTYDLYSLGCVLLEVFLWRPLEQILHTLGLEDSPSDSGTKRSANKTNEKAHERRLVVLKGRSSLLTAGKMDKVAERVAFAAGDRARRAVELCFHPETMSQTHKQRVGEEKTDIGAQVFSDEQEDYLEVSVDAQIQIVKCLRSLRQI